MKLKTIFWLLLLSCMTLFAPLAMAAEEFDLHVGQYAHPRSQDQVLVVAALVPKLGWYAYAPNPDDPLVRPPNLSIRINDVAIPNVLPPGKTKPDPLKPGQTVDIYDQATPMFLSLPQEAAGMEITARFTAVLCDGSKCILPRQKLTFQIAEDAAALPPLPPKLLSIFEQLTAAPEDESAPDQGAPQSLAVEEEAPTPGPGDAVWTFSPRPFAPSLEVSGLASAILLGLLAGLILNVMPCVLPVVSLKLSALMAGADTDDERERMRRFREHNLWFGLGVLVYFIFLAALLSLGGMAWGALFQSSKVIVILAGILLLLALSLLGLFHLPVIDLKFDQSTSNPKLKALATGMLATLMATPCSGPLLGGVLGWALLRPGAEVAAVFLAIGLGMASPYFLMLAYPGLARFFPKPGPWLAHMEKGVALFLLAAVIYLVTILPEAALVWPWLATLWCLGTAFWLWRISGGAMRIPLRAAALILAIAGPILFLMPSENHDPWTEFDAVEFRQQLGTTFMVLDFTADWCPTCKALEATVLTHDTVAELATEFDATFIRVDLTQSDPVREALLLELGSQSIPLVALFPSSEQASAPIVIRDLFTSSQLRQALTQARNESKP